MSQGHSRFRHSRAHAHAVPQENVKLNFACIWLDGAHLPAFHSSLGNIFSRPVGFHSVTMPNQGQFKESLLIKHTHTAIPNLYFSINCLEYGHCAQHTAPLLPRHQPEPFLRFAAVLSSLRRTSKIVALTAESIPSSPITKAVFASSLAMSQTLYWEPCLVNLLSTV